MILVTGATGLVGSHLLYSLLKDNQRVRAIHRSSSNLNTVRNLFANFTSEADRLFEKIEWVEANVTEIPALTDAFKDITHVYHCAAYISFNPKHYRKLKKANVEGTANIVNLCLANNVQKLCYMSSVATLGIPIKGDLINENTAWNPEDNNSVYAISKYGAELEVWRGAQEGLKTVIVNPGVILGEGSPNSGSSIIIKQAARSTSFYTSGGMGIVDVKDVVSASIALMESTTVNRNYVLVGKNLRYRDLLAELAIHLKKEAPRHHIPKWIFSFLRMGDWMSSKLLGTKRKLLKSTINSLYKTSYYDASRIEKEMNFKFTPYEETIKRVASNFRLNG
jgi:nucleoside-diphosphate-sugar epimerase